MHVVLSGSSDRDLTFVDTNPEHAANFCIARRSGGISWIVSGRLPRSRLRARVLDSPFRELLPDYKSSAILAVWSCSRGSCQALEVIAELGEFLNAVPIIVLAIRLAVYGGAHQGLIAHLATPNERDRGGCRDHPWAVNVVHNLLDFLADHPHTNDRV